MRALLSTYDKTGLVPFATSLADLGWQLVSSGGTSKALSEAGIDVTPVEQVTGAPEMLGGRVKTLHPKIHGGILADLDKDEHKADLASQGIEPFDLVVCNLYPFRSEPSIEMIDIGGPTMVRAAAKNHAHVGIVVNPDRYDEVIAELKADGGLAPETRRSLAREAFAHTAAYDAAIVTWFDEADDEPLPKSIHLALELEQPLRYGENPHLAGARYREVGAEGWWDTVQIHGGKALSYLNLYDTEAAWRLVNDMGERPAVAVIKHANPCGAAVADDIVEAYVRANACDPTSAFGGIVASNRPVTLEMAEALAPVFTEVVVAPSFEPDALAKLQEKKNLRILEAAAPSGYALDLRRIDGGLLAQQVDRVVLDRSGWSVPTERQPTDEEWIDLELAWTLAAHVKSNAIVLVKDGQGVGIGAGQQSRVDAARIAAHKADGRAKGGASASDAFYPFRDGLDQAAEAGCTAVIQPGGSIRDDEVIAAANEHGIAMAFTGMRHFKH